MKKPNNQSIVQLDRCNVGFQVNVHACERLMKWLVPLASSLADDFATVNNPRGPRFTVLHLNVFPYQNLDKLCVSKVFLLPRLIRSCTVLSHRRTLSPIEFVNSPTSTRLSAVLRHLVRHRPNKCKLGNDLEGSGMLPTGPVISPLNHSTPDPS